MKSGITTQCSDCTHRKDNRPVEFDAILISSASATVSAFIMCFWLFSLCHSHRAYQDSEHVEESLYAVRSYARSDSSKMSAKSNENVFWNRRKCMISDTSPRSQKLIVLKIWSTAPRFAKLDPAQGSPCTWFSSAPSGALNQVEPEHRQSLMAVKAVCQRSECNR